MNAYYTMLLEQPAVIVSGHHDTGAKISAHTVSRIHKLLKSAFGKAVAWEYTSTNPTLGATLPEQRSKERAVWSDNEAIEALNVCENPALRPHLSLSGLGMFPPAGGNLGLQWANVHIDGPHAVPGEANLKIDWELRRRSNESIRRFSCPHHTAALLLFNCGDCTAKSCCITGAQKERAILHSLPKINRRNKAISGAIATSFLRQR